MALIYSLIHHSQWLWPTRPKSRILLLVHTSRCSRLAATNLNSCARVLHWVSMSSWMWSLCTLVRYRLILKQTESWTLWTTVTYQPNSNLTLTKAICLASVRLSALSSLNHQHVLWSTLPQDAQEITTKEFSALLRTTKSSSWIYSVHASIFWQSQCLLCRNMLMSSDTKLLWVHIINLKLRRLVTQMLRKAASTKWSTTNMKSQSMIPVK